jgi:hypothetical protein
LAFGFCPTRKPGKMLDGVESTGDLVSSPADQSDLRYRFTRARPQLAPPPRIRTFRKPW